MSDIKCSSTFYLHIYAKMFFLKYKWIFSVTKVLINEPYIKSTVENIILCSICKSIWPLICLKYCNLLTNANEQKTRKCENETIK